MEKLANVANEIIDIWADDLKFSNGLARTFFAETVYHALRIAYRWGARAEARKRKASISARYQKRLTKRAPDLGRAGDSESQNTVAPSG